MEDDKFDRTLFKKNSKASVGGKRSVRFISVPSKSGETLKKSY